MVVLILNGKKKVILSLALILSLCIIAWIVFMPKENTVYGFKDDSNATAEKVETLATGINNFSINLYKKLSSENDGNIFFSPVSIEYALVIAYEGAKGKTKEEMEKVLNLPGDPNVRRPAFARIFNLLNKKGRVRTIPSERFMDSKEFLSFGRISESYRKILSCRSLYSRFWQSGYTK